MKLAFKIILLAGLAILSLFTSLNPAYAANACSTAIKYFYINGVSPSADTERGFVANEIQSLLLSRGIITTEIVSPLRNPSEGIFFDVFVELVNQKLAEKSAATFADAILKTTLLFSGDPAFTVSAADQSLLEARMADLFNRSQNLPGTTAITAGMIDVVVSSLNVGNKAVVIAHSQGNMFSNAILASVIAHQSPNIAAGLKIVSIATPSGAAQDARYKTANQDRVISSMATPLAILIGAPLPLPANIDVPGSIVYDQQGHGLLEVYLNQKLPAVDIIVELLINAISTSVNPRCPQVAAICPDTFTQTHLAQIVPGMTVSQADGIFGCAGRNPGFSNWYLWYNNQSLTSLTLNTASVYFTNGVYLAGSGKSISGTVIP